MEFENNPMEKILEKVKEDLGYRHTLQDKNILDVIIACSSDLDRVGIIFDPEDPLIIQCLKLYSRGFFNYQGDGEEYFVMYNQLRDAISLNKGRQQCIPK